MRQFYQLTNRLVKLLEDGSVTILIVLNPQSSGDDYGIFVNATLEIFSFFI